MQARLHARARAHTHTHTHLDAVQLLHACECGLCPVGQLADGHQSFSCSIGLGLECGHMHFIIALLARPASNQTACVTSTPKNSQDPRLVFMECACMDLDQCAKRSEFEVRVQTGEFSTPSLHTFAWHAGTLRHSHNGTLHLLISNRVIPSMYPHSCKANLKGIPPERALRQPGSLVALEVAPLLEGQGVKVHHLACCHLQAQTRAWGCACVHSPCTHLITETSVSEGQQRRATLPEQTRHPRRTAPDAQQSRPLLGAASAPPPCIANRGTCFSTHNRISISVPKQQSRPHSEHMPHHLFRHT
eukprot:1146539-Pelagomonas_calceolata.AAC.8